MQTAYRDVIFSSHRELLGTLNWFTEKCPQNFIFGFVRHKRLSLPTSTLFLSPHFFRKCLEKQEDHIVRISL